MRVVIAKVDENLYDGEAESLTVPGAAGEMTVLGEHMPVVTTLKEGTIVVRSKEGDKTFAISGGVMEIRRDGTTVIL